MYSIIEHTFLVMATSVAIIMSVTHLISYDLGNITRDTVYMRKQIATYLTLVRLCVISERWST